MPPGPGLVILSKQVLSMHHCHQLCLYWVPLVFPRNPGKAGLIARPVRSVANVILRSIMMIQVSVTAHTFLLVHTQSRKGMLVFIILLVSRKGGVANS